MRTVKLAVAALALTTALYGCSKSEQAPEQGPPPVTVATPLQNQVVDWDEVTGRFEATRSVDVRARVGGYIQSIHFKDGDNVRQGQLLFTLDARPAQAALAAARAQLAQAQAKPPWPPPMPPFVPANWMLSSPASPPLSRAASLIAAWMPAT